MHLSSLSSSGALRKRRGLGSPWQWGELVSQQREKAQFVPALCIHCHVEIKISHLSLLTTGKYWLHQALSCFCSSLESIGSHLVFLKSEGEGGKAASSLRILKELVKETGARRVLANALYEPWLKERDDAVVSALQKDGVECRMFHSYCLRDPYSVSTEGVGLRG